jgi:outer membrane protein, multidrug efflux system
MIYSLSWRKWGAVLLVPCLLGLLSGCIVGPDYKLPQTQVPEAFANQTQAGLSPGGVETFWWRDFQDTILHQLLDAQDRLAASATLIATTLVAVYKALGGEWENAPERGLRTSAVSASSVGLAAPVCLCVPNA